LLDGVIDGERDPIGRKKAVGRTPYTEKIEKAHPGYLHELYRYMYAIRMKGSMASFQEIADCMNAKSATPDEPRTTVTLHRLQLFSVVEEAGRERKIVDRKTEANEPASPNAKTHESQAVPSSKSSTSKEVTLDVQSLSPALSTINAKGLPGRLMAWPRARAMESSDASDGAPTLFRVCSRHFLDDERMRVLKPLSGKGSSGWSNAFRTASTNSIGPRSELGGPLVCVAQIISAIIASMRL
jgi:hypothetical protein